jgi:hypothetical protein
LATRVFLQTFQNTGEINGLHRYRVPLLASVLGLDILKLVISNELALQRIVVLVIVQLRFEMAIDVMIMQTLDRFVVEHRRTVELYHVLSLAIKDDDEDI